MSYIKKRKPALKEPYSRKRLKNSTRRKLIALTILCYVLGTKGRPISWKRLEKQFDDIIDELHDKLDTTA